MRNIALYTMLTFFITFNSKAQNNKQGQIDYLNDVITYANENIHGLMILHRMFEYQNLLVLKKLNKDVKIFNVMESDNLPFNIFDDPKKWLFEKSPNEIYHEIKKNKDVLPKSKTLNVFLMIDEMYAITNELDQLRFEIEGIIKNLPSDLKETDIIINELKSHFKLVERQYDSYFELNIEFENLMQNIITDLNLISDENQNIRFLMLCDEIYGTQKKIAMSYYKKDVSNIDSLYKVNLNLLKKIENTIRPHALPKYMEKANNYTENITKQILKINDKIKSSDDPNNENMKSYEKMDPFYLNYNFKILSSLNRYGNGLIYELNRLISLYNIPKLKYLELPNYYKMAWIDE